MLFDILKTAVFNPAKDKLHPPLLIIGKGRINLLLSPFLARISISGPPGNSTPRILAVLSKASPNASSIVVPSLV